MIIVKGNQLPYATRVASLAILLRSSAEIQMPKMLGLEARVLVTKAMAIRAVVMVMVLVIGNPVIGPMPWMPMSSRGIQLISLQGIDQGLQVIMFIVLTRFSQKAGFLNYSL